LAGDTEFGVRWVRTIHTSSPIARRAGREGSEEELIDD
jgi:hypothetical protein